AEYETLLHGLRMAKEIGINRIECRGDTDLVVQQCNGTWDTVDPNMDDYHRAVDKIGAHFASFEFKHIDRRLNKAADALSRLGSSRAAVGPRVFLEHIHQPSIKAKSEAALANPTHD
ncbi:reverse transcriptase-like protein, partial [Streptomyces albiflaviniger]|nr:reverse transcriptase-like protein [Streptomyces albiflaviniger]